MQIKQVDCKMSTKKIKKKKKTFCDTFEHLQIQEYRATKR